MPSMHAGTAEGLMTSSQATSLNHENDCESENFDLSDKSFSSFQNSKACAYLNLSSTFGHQSNNELFLFHLNIRSFHKNFDSLCDLLSKLPQKPHIIGLSEAKIKDKPQINISIPVYTFLRNNSDTNAGGVGVYVSDFFQFQELTFKASFSGCESLWIKLSCPNTEINYVVGTIYRHPNTNTNAFCDYLNKILSDLNMNKKYVFRTR